MNTKEFVFYSNECIQGIVRSIADEAGVILTDEHELPKEPRKDLESNEMAFYHNVFKPKILLGRDAVTRRIRKSDKVLQYSSTIRKYADEYGVPANIMAALIHQESSGIADITANGSSARGLGQFTIKTARNLGLRVDGFIDERTDPDKAIKTVAMHLSDLASKFDGDYSKALVAYHEGEGGARKFINLLESGRTADSLASMATNKTTGEKELFTYLSNINALAGEYQWAL